MKVYQTNEIKNISILGSSGSGKTTLVEAMLFESGVIKRRGSVAAKNTVSDYFPVEQEYGYSVFSTVLHVEWNNKKLNIIDCPGSDDFVGSTVTALNVTDTAIILLNGQYGVEVGTQNHFRYTEKLNKPVIFLVNQLDNEKCDYDNILEQLKEAYGSKVVPIQYPISTGPGFNALIDVLLMKKYSWKPEGGAPTIEDIPAEEKLDFFKKPAEFLTSAASSKDQKNGYVFSHVDSVLTTSRATSTYPSFGFEAALVRTEGGTNALRVLYTQPNSPAEEAGLKRGDWIIAVDNQKVSTSDYSTYITRPTKAYSFTLGKYNPYPEEVDDPEFNYVEFDTLGVVQMPEPRYVEEQDVLKYSIISSGSRKAFYLLYNEFGESADALKEAFSQLNGQQFDDIILDLRYNPGGYVNTSQQLCSALAPATAMGQPFLDMTYNDKIAKTESYLFEPSLIPGGTPLAYENLYIITSNNTASASEIVINCLRPYLKERLLQVGTATFGKNVAQSLFTDEQSPQLELWLTTAYLSNAEGFQDYFDNGLQPDYELAENYAGELGELGTAEDMLLAPVFTRMATGNFPAGEDTATETTRSNPNVEVTHCSISKKPKLAKNNFH